MEGFECTVDRALKHWQVIPAAHAQAGLQITYSAYVVLLEDEFDGHLNSEIETPVPQEKSALLSLQ